jgi:hypothetical protein
VNRLIVERAPGSAVEIVVLAASQRLQKSGEPEGAKTEAGRDEPGECRHDMSLRRLCPSQTAFAVTVTDDADMAMAATSGVTTPIMASGKNRTL